MKGKDLLILTLIGIAVWFFLKPKEARAEEIAEEIPKLEQPEVLIKPAVYPAELEIPIEERPCYLTSYPCFEWYRTQYKIGI